MYRYLLGLLLATVVLAWPAAAQEQRASVQGTVKDSQTAVLPGVTVDARNTVSGAVTSVVTDSQGQFRFPALSPGTYTITAQLSGFKTTKVENLELLLGQIKTVDFTLEVAGVTEEVIVTGESPLVDTRQSARATSLRVEQIDELPKGRDFSSLIQYAPGANPEAKLGGMSIDGSSAAENRYIVDGVDTTNLQNGTEGKGLIADFVEEIQVKSSGYTAEYGGATGGVINVMTKSGTNAFRGTGLFYYQGSALQSARRPSLRISLTDPTKAEYINYPKDTENRLEPGFSLGGPIVKDRSWFFAAYQPTVRSIERSVDPTTASNPAAATVGNKQRLPVQYLTANQTNQISNSIRTRVAFNNSWSRTDGLLPALSGLDPAGTNYAVTRTYPNWSLSGQLDWIAKSNLFFGFRAGYYTSNQRDSGVANVPRYNWTTTSNVGFLDVPASLQRGTGFTSVPTNSSTDYDKQKRLSFQADGTVYKNMAGQHTIKGGVQFDTVGNDVLTGELRPRVTIRWGSAYSGTPGAGGVTTGKYGYYSVRSNAVNPQKGFITEGNVGTTNVGLFVQDAWTINDRVTINLGLRTERENIPAYAASPGIPTYGLQFSFKDKLAPRAGMAWDIKGDGKWKTYASWGIFYDIFKYELPRGSFGGDKWLEYYYTLDTYDWPNLLASSACPPQCPGTPLNAGQPIDFRRPSFGADAIQPGLKPVKQQEASVGLEHQLNRVTAIGLRYVHKQLDRTIEDTGSLDQYNNEIYIIANPAEGLTAWAYPGVPMPKAVRRYDSFEVSIDKRLSNKYSFRLSYLLSRLYGNYSGLSQSDENGRVSPNVGRQYDYPLMEFDQSGQPVYGRLATDRPNQFKAQFTYVLPFGTTFGVFQRVLSGLPVTRELAVLPSNNYPVQYLGRMSDGRTATFTQTDVSVAHSFKFAGNKQIQLSFNVLNVLDQKAGISKYSTQNRVDGIRFNEADFYAGKLNFSNLIAAQGVKIDPRFLQYNAFQDPLEARIGFKFLF